MQPTPPVPPNEKPKVANDINKMSEDAAFASILKSLSSQVESQKEPQAAKKGHQLKEGVLGFTNPNSKEAKIELIKAVESQSLERLRLCVQAGVNLKLPLEEVPLLFRAVEQGWVEGVRWLAKSRDVDRVMYRTPEVGSRSGKKESVDLLPWALSKGSDVMQECVWSLSSTEARLKSLEGLGPLMNLILLALLVRTGESDWYFKNQKNFNYEVIIHQTTQTLMGIITGFKEDDKVITVSKSGSDAGSKKQKLNGPINWPQRIDSVPEAKGALGVLKVLPTHLSVAGSAYLMGKLMYLGSPELLEVCARAGALPRADGALVGPKEQLLKNLRQGVFKGYEEFIKGDQSMHLHVVEIACLTYKIKEPNDLLCTLIKLGGANIINESVLAQHGLLMNLGLGEMNEQLRVLKSCGVEVDKIKDLGGGNPLHLACGRGGALNEIAVMAQIKELIELNPSWGGTRNKKGQLPKDMMGKGIGSVSLREKLAALIEEGVLAHEIEQSQKADSTLGSVSPVANGSASNGQRSPTQRI